MAYLTIQINMNPNGASPEVGPSLGTLKGLLGGTAASGASNPSEVVDKLQNIMDGIKSGTIAATVSVASSSNANLTITATPYLNGTLGVFSGVSGADAVNISATPLNFK